MRRRSRPTTQPRSRKTVLRIFALSCALLALSGCQSSNEWAAYTGALKPIVAPKPAINPARFCATAEPITDASSDQIEEHNAIGQAICGWPS